jgi:hypothetical protein
MNQAPIETETHLATILPAIDNLQPQSLPRRDTKHTAEAQYSEDGRSCVGVSVTVLAEHVMEIIFTFVSINS